MAGLTKSDLAIIPLIYNTKAVSPMRFQMKYPGYFWSYAQFCVLVVNPGQLQKD